jgi:hypothetical protein
MGGADHLAVGLLRVVDRTGDGLRARLAADRLLSAASPAARGLGPEQILIVRCLRDPLPGTCGDAPSRAAVACWRAAAEVRLEQARVQAARPAAGPVPTTAPAVLFEDLAELLACLTIDAGAGAAESRWWWRSWLGGLPAGAAVQRAWIEHAAQAPAALELMSARAAGGALARALSPTAAAAITVAIAGTYELPGEDRAPATAAARPWRSGPTREPAPHVPPAPPADAADPVRALLAIAPELAACGLPFEHRRLLGLGLTLRRRRGAAGAGGFWQALDELAGSPTAPDPPPREPAPSPTRSPERPVRPGAATVARRPTGGGHAGEAASSDGAEAPAPDEPSGTGHVPARRPLPFARATGSPERTGAPPAARELPAQAVAPNAEHRIAVTELGGLFMLPGIALHLGLYGDFSSPRGPNLALDPWDLVALLGRALAPRAARADPVWGLLAELAGRAAGEPPGVGFRAPLAWRLPADWLAPVGSGRGPWRWHAADGRLRVRHPEGFLVLDIALRGRPAGALLERELRRWGRPRALGAPDLPVPRRGGAPLQRWVESWLAPYVGARLRVAIGARRASAAAAVMLRRPARVVLSPGRVDVTFALDELPVAIRIAGLDRTPGWIPAAGRHLEIHFA